MNDLELVIEILKPIQRIFNSNQQDRLRPVSKIAASIIFNDFLFGNYLSKKAKPNCKDKTSPLTNSLFDCCKQFLEQLLHPSTRPSPNNIFDNFRSAHFLDISLHNFGLGLRTKAQIPQPDRIFQPDKTKESNQY